MSETQQPSTGEAAPQLLIPNQEVQKAITSRLKTSHENSKTTRLAIEDTFIQRPDRAVPAEQLTKIRQTAMKNFLLEQGSDTRPDGRGPQVADPNRPESSQRADRVSASHPENIVSGALFQNDSAFTADLKTTQDQTANHDAQDQVAESTPGAIPMFGNHSTVKSQGLGYIESIADPTVDETRRRAQRRPHTFRCHLCTKRFIHAYSFGSHLRSHTDERPFVCAVCNKAFARQHDRMRHQRLHGPRKRLTEPLDRNHLDPYSDASAQSKVEESNAFQELLGSNRMEYSDDRFLSNLEFSHIRASGEHREWIERLDGKIPQYLLDQYYPTPASNDHEFEVISNDATLYPSTMPSNPEDSACYVEPHSAFDVGTVQLSENTKEFLADTIASYMRAQAGYVTDTALPSDTIQDLLRMFAIIQSHAATSSTDGTAAEVFCQLRKLIAERYLQATDLGQDESQSGESMKAEYEESSTSLHDRIVSWMTQVPYEPSKDEADLVTLPEKTQCKDNMPDNSNSVLEAHALQGLISSSNWSWLMSRIKGSSNLTMPQSSISQDLLAALTTDTRTRSVEVQYFVDWDVLHYYETLPSGSRLADIVTLSSDGQNLQALTCSQHVQQYWPERGVKVLDVLQTAIDQSVKHLSSKCTTSANIAPGFKISVVVRRTSLSVSAGGPLAFTLELGELLAWLGAVMSANPTDIVFMSPQVRLHASLPQISITYSSSHKQLPGETSCWRALFRNCSIAESFPVPTRKSGQVGMEMTLDIMVALGGTQWATSWSNRFMLKGLASMFYPVVEFGRELTWHVKHVVGDTCLSHAEGLDSCLEGGPLAGIVSALSTMRHFIGWTPVVQTIIGTQYVDYAAVREPSRTESTSGLVLERATISASQYLGASVSIARGRHSQPIWYAASTSYEAVLEFASNMPIVLYDTRARRGYLADGCSVLLHLCCSRIWSKNARRFFDREALQAIANFRYANASTVEAGVERALRTLNDPHNRALVLRTMRHEEVEETEVTHGNWRPQRKVKVDSWRFEHLVVETWQYLHKIFDYQVSPPSGIDIRLTDRDRLEGWSFKSIVDRVPLLRPKMVYLRASGRGWNDFIRTAGATTLMADGFGDILHDAVSICPAWTSVPPQLDYLAAPVSTLREIYDRDPAELSFPSALGSNTYWHKPHLLFETCHLESACGVNGRCCDRLQVLLPRSWLGKRNIPADLAMCEQGAVIFGHSPRHQFEWPVSGAPKRTFTKCKSIFRREVVSTCLPTKRPFDAEEPQDTTMDKASKAAIIPQLSLPGSDDQLEASDEINIDNPQSGQETWNSASSSRGSSVLQRIASSSDEAERSTESSTVATSHSNSMSMMTSTSDSIVEQNATEAEQKGMDNRLGKQPLRTGAVDSRQYRAPVACVGPERRLKRKKRFTMDKMDQDDFDILFD